MRTLRWLSILVGTLAVSLPARHVEAIAPGETVSGFVNGEVEQDMLSFSSTGPDVLVIRETITSGNLAARFLLSGDLTSCSVGGGTSGNGFGMAGNVATIFKCPVAADDYTLFVPLEVALGNGAGDYRIHMQSLAAPVGATPLTIGGTVSGTISEPGEMDTFTMPMVIGDVVKITVSRTSGTLDPNFQLVHGAGADIGDKICGGGGLQPDPTNNPVLEWECGNFGVPGQMVLLVHDLDDSGTTPPDENETGDYDVTVTCLAGPCLTATTTTTTVTTTTTTSPAASTTTTSTTLPGTVDQLIGGKKLVLKDKPNKPHKRALNVVSDDAGIDLGLGNGSTDDPRTVGATLRVYSTGGGFDATYPMPANRWKLIGAEGLNKGYKYVDGGGQAGAMRHATLKPGILKLAGKGAGLGHVLAADPDPVHVVLTIGTTRYCASFGGSTSHKAGKSFIAKSAPAPAACP